MDLVLALLASPLLGPAVWAPVAEHLSRRGWSVLTPAASEAPRTPDDVLRSFLSALPADQALVLVPHSNAGLYVPALTVQRRVAGYVFVDAGLPATHGRVPLTPPALLDVLTRMADTDGLVPPWSRWWDEAELAPLFPDATVRTRVEREQHRLPLSYFSQSLPVPSSWDDRPGGYLAFGDTYASDRRAAADRGWPVTTLPGGHLHMLIDPQRVATEIDTLLTMVGVGPDRGRLPGY